MSHQSTSITASCTPADELFFLEQVEAIVGHRAPTPTDPLMRFHVQWKGSKTENRTWEAAANIDANILQQYLGECQIDPKMTSGQQQEPEWCTIGERRLVDERRQVQRIVGLATSRRVHGLVALVKWQGVADPEPVRVAHLRKHRPEELLEFYEKCLCKKELKPFD